MGTRIRESRERSDAKPATRKQERVSEVDSPRESWEEFLPFSFFSPVFYPERSLVRVTAGRGEEGERGGTQQRALISTVASSIVIFGVNREETKAFSWKSSRVLCSPDSRARNYSQKSFVFYFNIIRRSLLFIARLWGFPLIFNTKNEIIIISELTKNRTA